MNDGPYAVHYTRRRADGALVSVPPARNLTGVEAVRYLTWIRAQPDVVEAHMSPDTCG